MIDYLRGIIFSNPLVVDKISHQFLYEKDSGFIVAKQIIQSLPKTYRLYWFIPDKIKDHSWFLEAHPNIEIIQYPYSTNIHQNRFEFYGNIFRNNFPYTKDVDFVMCHQPEVAGAIRTWAENARRDNPIILSFHHWIDCEESRKFSKGSQPFNLRSLEGYLASDINYFHNWYALNLFRNANNKSFRGTDNRYDFFQPQVFLKDVEASSRDFSKYGKIIVFNHRLNNTTKWKKVLKICKSIYDEGENFTLWFTQANSMKYDKSEYPFVVEESLSQEDYKALLRDAHFSVCNHEGYSTWNMAVVDSLYNDCLPLVPQREVYLDMFQTVVNQYTIFHSDSPVLEKQIKRHLGFSREEIKERTELVKESCSNLFAYEVMNPRDISRLIEQRTPKEIKKYDKVKEFILMASRTKRNWVNKFWSFHVNSNFQKIRWKLLQDGFKDDTTSSESIYYKGD